MHVRARGFAVFRQIEKRQTARRFHTGRPKPLRRNVDRSEDRRPFPFSDAYSRDDNGRPRDRCNRTTEHTAFILTAFTYAFGSVLEMCRGVCAAAAAVAAAPAAT